MPPVRGRKRRAVAPVEAEPESSPEPATQRQRPSQDASEDEYNGEGIDITANEGNLEDLVKKMVRFALACEYQRRPIRRADISDKVLGIHGRKFRTVFNEAQLRLRNVFGMELVELPAREKVTLQQKRAAKGASQQPKAVTSWVLTSILPSEFRDPAIQQPPAAPTSEEESKYTGVYTMLVSLISLSGGTLPDTKMERYLQKLQMSEFSPIAEYEKTEKLLKRLEKDSYISRVRESTGTGEDNVYWIVGPRGKVEVGDDGIRGLTKTVFGSMGEAEEEELERKIRRSLAMGERAPDRRAALPLETQKKRGRPRRNVQEEDDRSQAETDKDDEEDDDDDDE